MVAQMVLAAVRSSWQAEREMAPGELYALQVAFDMSQSEFAKYLGIGERSMRRYLQGTAPIPVAVVLLLRALCYYDVTPYRPETNG
jgi:DNA-binding transcriptional regulator YiaG